MMLTIARKALAILFALFAALMLYTALTVPMIAATAPAVLLFASAAATWVMWPKSKGPKIDKLEKMLEQR